LARVVVVVPGVVVHVRAAVVAVWTVVIRVAERGAHGNAGRESNHAGGHDLIGVVGFDDHGRGAGRLRVDGRRVVLRDVDHLRIGRFDDDDLLAAGRGPGLHLLL